MGKNMDTDYFNYLLDFNDKNINYVVQNIICINLKGELVCLIVLRVNDRPQQFINVTNVEMCVVVYHNARGVWVDKRVVLVVATQYVRLVARADISNYKSWKQ